MGSFGISVKNHGWIHICGSWDMSELLLGKFVLPEVLHSHTAPLQCFRVNFVFWKDFINFWIPGHLFWLFTWKWSFFLESPASVMRPEVPQKRKSMSSCLFSEGPSMSKLSVIPCSARVLSAFSSGWKASFSSGIQGQRHALAHIYSVVFSKCSYMAKSL